MPPLRSRRWERFANEYVIDHNATRAYVDAGYSCSREVAGRNGYRLLRNAEIAERISELEERIADQLGITHSLQPAGPFDMSGG
jgi:phage terminase small subunit